MHDLHLHVRQMDKVAIFEHCLRRIGRQAERVRARVSVVDGPGQLDGSAQQRGLKEATMGAAEQAGTMTAARDDTLAGELRQVKPTDLQLTAVEARGIPLPRTLLHLSQPT
jgi:hypothetical protein